MSKFRVYPSYSLDMRHHKGYVDNLLGMSGTFLSWIPHWGGFDSGQQFTKK